MGKQTVGGAEGERVCYVAPRDGGRVRHGRFRVVFGCEMST